MLYKTNWQNLIGTNAIKLAISSKGVRGANINCDIQHFYLSLSIKVALVFGEYVDNNCIISMYSVDRSTGDVDSFPLWQQRVKSYSNSERIITIPNLNVSSLDTIRVEIKNNNNTSSVYAWVSYKASYNQ
jgi:hypothetical protein